jgi:hypothetical protein
MSPLSRVHPALLVAASAFLLIVCPSARAEKGPIITSTNTWRLEAADALERTTFVIAPGVEVAGSAKNDSFWIAETIQLDGLFHNDAWAIGSETRLNGIFHDHARVAARSLHVNAAISNGLWAAAGSIATTTNSMLGGDNYLFANNLSLLGDINGNLHARGNQITLGGNITGDVHLYGNDIVIRPGTVINGSIHYDTAGEPIIVGSASKVSGEVKRMIPPANEETSSSWQFGFGLFSGLFWFAAALLVGLPFMLIFPRFTGKAVQGLRASTVKCGLVGLAALILTPIFLFMLFFTIVGIPMVFVTAAAYGLLLYFGKFPVALALGSALLMRRGQISFSLALLALVIGLAVFYSMAMVPLVGGSLQTAASAFGAGSILIALVAGRGRVGNQINGTARQPKA